MRKIFHIEIKSESSHKYRRVYMFETCPLHKTKKHERKNIKNGQ